MALQGTVSEPPDVSVFYESPKGFMCDILEQGGIGLSMQHNGALDDFLNCI